MTARDFNIFGICLNSCLRALFCVFCLVCVVCVNSLALWAQTCISVAGTWQESAFGFGFQLTQSTGTVSGTMTFVNGCGGVSYGVNGSVTNGQFTINATPNGHGTCFDLVNGNSVPVTRVTYSGTLSSYPECGTANNVSWSDNNGFSGLTNWTRTPACSLPSGDNNFSHGWEAITNDILSAIFGVTPTSSIGQNFLDKYVHETPNTNAEVLDVCWDNYPGQVVSKLDAAEAAQALNTTWTVANINGVQEIADHGNPGDFVGLARDTIVYYRQHGLGSSSCSQTLRQDMTMQCGLAPTFTFSHYKYNDLVFNIQGQTGYQSCRGGTCYSTTWPDLSAPTISATTVTTASNVSIQISWTSIKGDKTGFRLWKQAGADPWNLIGPTSTYDNICSGNSCSYTDGGLCMAN
jgi:hypothetical protein